MEPKWLRWARQLLAIAQNGLTYSEGFFDRERYEQLRRLGVEMMAEQSDADYQKTLDLFSAEVGYATPKVDVRGVVFRNDRILMVKELTDGCWSLPGGWVDVNESPSEAAVREIAEETGFQTKAVKLLALWDREKHPHFPPYPFHIYKINMLCELLGGEAAPSYETPDVGFFAEDALPKLSVDRVTSDQIARLFEHHRNADLPTDFD